MNKIISIDIYGRDVMVHFGEKKALEGKTIKDIRVREVFRNRFYD